MNRLTPQQFKTLCEAIRPSRPATPVVEEPANDSSELSESAYDQARHAAETYSDTEHQQLIAHARKLAFKHTNMAAYHNFEHKASQKREDEANKAGDEKAADKHVETSTHHSYQHDYHSGIAKHLTNLYNHLKSAPQYEDN